MGVQRSATVPPDSAGGEERELRIVLEIERGGPCSLDELAGRILDVDDRLDAETCNVDATVKDEESDQVRTMFFADELCSHCPGKIFTEHGCLPRYRRIEEGSFVMETYASDTDTVAEIVNEVRTISDHVSVKSIVPTDDGDVSEIDVVDLTSLTDKQRRALHYAKEAGYYDSGASVSLDQLADRMGVSTSALSQLLQRAEANVLRQLDCDCES